MDQCVTLQKLQDESCKIFFCLARACLRASTNRIKFPFRTNKLSSAAEVAKGEEVRRMLEDYKIIPNLAIMTSRQVKIELKLIQL